MDKDELSRVWVVVGLVSLGLGASAARAIYDPPVNVFSDVIFPSFGLGGVVFFIFYLLSLLARYIVRVTGVTNIDDDILRRLSYVLGLVCWAASTVIVHYMLSEQTAAIYSDFDTWKLSAFIGFFCGLLAWLFSAAICKLILELLGLVDIVGIDGKPPLM